jgi:hypothetical protein
VIGTGRLANVKCRCTKQVRAYCHFRKSSQIPSIAMHAAQGGGREDQIRTTETERQANQQIRILTA